MIHDTVLINDPDSAHNIIIESEQWKCVSLSGLYGKVFHSYNETKDSALYFTNRESFDSYVQSNWITYKGCSGVPKMKIDFDKFDCFVVCIPTDFGCAPPDYKCNVYKKNNHYIVFIHLFVPLFSCLMREYFIRYFLLPKGELMPPEIHYYDRPSSISIKK
ncbi:MAG TPA: hypothetical protein VNG53_11215 [Bacteroidia bacterium]|nr:hypothetical protein [Bacteroidia bacterium]